jgi:hypothetical protein
VPSSTCPFVDGTLALKLGFFDGILFLSPAWGMLFHVHHHGRGEECEYGL